MSKNPILAALADFGGASEEYKSSGRGRPERSPQEKASYELRRADFGRHLRRIRTEAGLTISEAARMSGVSSPRKLAQYESLCYPPGNVLSALAKVYGIEPLYLGRLLLSRMDPHLYEMLTGEPGFKTTRSEISAYLKNNTPMGAEV